MKSDEIEYTNFQKKLMENYGSKDLDEEQEDLYNWLMNAPEHYQNDDKMEQYYNEHPDATLEELDKYWVNITPPGLAPGDDGSDEDDDDD